MAETSNTTLTSKEEAFIHASLTEYSELRAELRDFQNQQTTIITFAITALGVLLGIGINGLSNEKFSHELSGVIFYILIPGISIFTGVHWIEQVYRQVSLGAYVSKIETRVCSLLDNGGKAHALNWEHFTAKRINHSESNLLLHRLFSRTNLLRYSYSMAAFLLTPICSILCVSGFYKVPLGLAHFLFIVFLYIMFGVYFYAYYRAIKNIHRSINRKKERKDN